jgi:anti-sigma factor RsiW
MGPSRFSYLFARGKGGDRALRAAEAATCDDGCLLCRACRNRRRGRATSRRSRRGCSRSRQRRRWQRDIFSFRRCRDLQCCRRSCAARAVYRGEGAGGTAGGIAGPGAADRHPPLRLWLDPVVTTAICSARDYAGCGRYLDNGKAESLIASGVCPRSLGREII